VGPCRWLDQHGGRPLALVAEAERAPEITVARDDDLEGARAAETVRFWAGGTAYEIDVNTKNAAAFRRTLAPFAGHARRAGRGPRRRAGRPAAGRERGAAIGAWAAEQGIAVSARGRIPAGVVAQYEAATGGG
jgi:hypothetical protein